jgi:Ca-activated chloride channel homolog
MEPSQSALKSLIQKFFPSFDVFHTPEILWAFLILPLLAALYFYREFHKKSRKKAAIQFSNLELIKGLPKSTKLKLRHSLFLLRLISLAFLIIALARPQYGESFEKVSTHGVDIVLAIDVSGSMQAMDLISKRELSKVTNTDVERFYKKGMDLHYSRLGVAKRVVSDFIDKRKSDRIGLVVFAGESQTQCPITLDYNVLHQIIKPLKYPRRNSKGGVIPGTVNQDGTAMGDALMTSINRLKKNPTAAKSRVIILLTDGRNNAGFNPEKAAQVAQSLGIKVYTIGIGKARGTYPVPTQSFFGGLSWGEQEIDKNSSVDGMTLEKIARLTEGQFYRATNQKELAQIYDQIDALEKTKIESNTITKYHEQFFIWLLLGVAFFFFELLIRYTYLRKLP